MSYILKIALGSESVLKRDAVIRAGRIIGREIALYTHDARSGVSQQPNGLEEMRQGATARAKAALAAHPQATFGLGIESGLVNIADTWYDVPCVVLLEGSRHYAAYGAFFPVPAFAVRKALLPDGEIGKVVQKLAGGGEKDVMAYFSKGLLNRTEIIATAIAVVFQPVLHLAEYAERS